MIYLAEVGPVLLGLFESWVVFIFDDAGGAVQVTPHVAHSRFDARKWAAADLRARGAKKVRCAPTLGNYGFSRGWKVEPFGPSRAVETAAALISLENEVVLGSTAFSPTIERLIEEGARFQRARPWLRTALADKPVVITRRGETRIAAVIGDGDAPPGVMLFPDMGGYERAVTMKPEHSALSDAVLVALMRSQSRTAKLVEQATGQRFNLLLHRRRRGRESVFTEEDIAWARHALWHLTEARGTDLQRGGENSREEGRALRE